jgi:DNA-binding MarR family transcriptional regulator
METRANVDNSVDTEDYEILQFLYMHGSATIEEIESHAALTWDETVNEIATLLNRGYIEGITGSSLA